MVIAVFLSQMNPLIGFSICWVVWIDEDVIVLEVLLGHMSEDRFQFTAVVEVPSHVFRDLFNGYVVVAI